MNHYWSAVKPVLVTTTNHYWSDHGPIVVYTSPSYSVARFTIEEHSKEMWR